MRLVELTRDTRPTLEELFSATKTVGGCHCMWFMRSTCPRLDRSKTTASDGGPDTWTVTCFFVHRAGLTLVERRGARRALVRKDVT